MFILLGNSLENITFTISDSSMTINGSGDMPNYSSVENTPWFSNKDTISNIIIQPDITSIGRYAFQSFSNLVSISIPSSVVNIGDDAFDNCKKLKEINSLSHVQFIGKGSFTSCQSLQSVDLSNAISIGETTFQRCSELASVVFSDSLQFVGYYLFAECISLDNVVIPPSLDTISDFMFTECIHLTNIVIPRTITINRGAFSYTNISSIELPDNMQIIYDMTFYAASLVHITIPDSVYEIQSLAFAGCPYLEEVIIGKNASTILKAAFGASPLHQMFYVSELNPNFCSIDGVVYSKNKTIIVSFPSGRRGYFSIPKTVITINEYAFPRCLIHTVCIPDSVLEIRERAFIESNVSVIYQGEYDINCLDAFADSVVNKLTVRYWYKNKTFCGLNVTHVSTYEFSASSKQPINLFPLFILYNLE